MFMPSTLVPRPLPHQIPSRRVTNSSQDHPNTSSIHHYHLLIVSQLLIPVRDAVNTTTHISPSLFASREPAATSTAHPFRPSTPRDSRHHSLPHAHVFKSDLYANRQACLPALQSRYQRPRRYQMDEARIHVYWERTTDDRRVQETGQANWDHAQT